MSKVLISPREVRQFEERYRDVLVNAGLAIAYPPPADVNQLTPDELRAALAGVSAVVAGSEAYTTALLDERPQLRVIARVGVGYDAIDVAAATAHGVAVTIAPNTNQGSVAEHTFALLLGFTRHLPLRHESVTHGRWPRLMSQPLRGCTLGLAGMGRIGKAVTVRARAFDMRVLAYDPQPDLAFASAHEVTLVPFDRLLAESDYLSLHLPLTPETRGLINRTTLARMKAGAVLINTSRGALVREADLVEALESRQIAGAALDVFEQEPPPADHPLLKMDNVVLTPHAAGVDILSLGDMARSAAEAVAALARGDWPAEKVVNPEVRPRFRW